MLSTEPNRLELGHYFQVSLHSSLPCPQRSEGDQVLRHGVPSTARHGPYLSSICLASPPSAAAEGEKNISLGAFRGDFFNLEWVLKYSDLWLVVEFIKVIFPDAVVLGQLTH